MELVSSQRDAFQAALKDIEAKAQQVQNNAELAANQRDALQARLKDAEARAQQAQNNTELRPNQDNALQASYPPNSARTFRRKAPQQGHRSARQLADAEAKRRLLELWHRTLAKSENPKSWAILSRKDKRN
jgi:hypothetical protein